MTPIVLCPFLTHIEPACDRGLRELERAGFTVRRFATTAAVDRARSDAASAALADGAEAILWIDSDMRFTVESVRQLCAHQLPVVAGLYAKKGVRDFAVALMPETHELRVGDGGGPCEVRYVGAGFLYTERKVYEDVRRTFSLPVCNTRFGAKTVPYFLPMVVLDPQGPKGSYWYLGEDYAFCERARQAGYKIIVDTALRLGHIGAYTYGWEDVGQQVPRVTGATFRFGESRAGGAPPELVDAPSAPSSASVASPAGLATSVDSDEPSR